MAAAELYDYLSQTTPDYDFEMGVTPSRVVQESGAGWEKVIAFYGPEEERLSWLDQMEFYFVLQWDNITAADAGTIFDFYCDYTKAHRTNKTFKFEHPTDGHVYVVRFAAGLERTIMMANIMAIQSIRLKITGRRND
jgi:hypothetical protein